MQKKMMTGAEIRQSFINFFKERGHTYVPSSSLVPGGDQTLLFTNAGMVQFKNIFLGEETRPYTRAVNSQKCMRVAGKHNDLDEVGRDDTHHTFFEMLGNWSFGDYYKKEAIEWAWELLTEVWGLDKSRLWATCFKDEYGEIPTDEEAYQYWSQQSGMNPEHILFFGRKDNFWEMADIGPCGPCSEIHVDYGPEFCNKKDDPNHVCSVNGDCKRFMEIWNLVFIQYNRAGPNNLEPLPAKHVDTGMGFERIVSLLQGVRSNYQIDLLKPCMDAIQELTGHTGKEREENITPYRVITDHARSAAFLIADGVIPGNTGRNYICRMIIRRAARFGTKIGLNKPFLARIAEKVIESYSGAYPELLKNRRAILDNVTREEMRFEKTVESGLSYLYELLDNLKAAGNRILPGDEAFDLYATHGLPFEITRDIALEQNMDVDELGFRQAMEEHRLISGSGKAFGAVGGEEVDLYREIFETLVKNGKLSLPGVVYDPYKNLEKSGELLTIVEDGEPVDTTFEGANVAVIFPETCFYIESGGQVSDQGVITALDEAWEINVVDVRKPAAGIIIHVGQVVKGNPRIGDMAKLSVNRRRRMDIMRNHTATHLLHAALQRVLGGHARQAGSLVAPDRLRFDFTHPQALSHTELVEIESMVNSAVMDNYPLVVSSKPLTNALEEGATALFGEKYDEMVRTVKIEEAGSILSYELCGGTHVQETGQIGIFIIVSEGSVASGIRRIEAITGWSAYQYVQKQFDILRSSAQLLTCGIAELPQKIQSTMQMNEDNRKLIVKLRNEHASVQFSKLLEKVSQVEGINYFAGIMNDVDVDTLQNLTDRFRERYQTGIVVLGSIYDGKPILVVAVSEDLVKSGWHAGNLIKEIARLIDGGGGGKPTMARAGGKDISGLEKAIHAVPNIIKKYKDER